MRTGLRDSTPVVITMISHEGQTDMGTLCHLTLGKTRRPALHFGKKAV